MTVTTHEPADADRPPPPLPAEVGNTPARRARRRWWYLLFLVQFVAVLWPPFYNRADPYWFGIPFFYWYQLLWVVVGGVCTALVYLATRERA